MKTGNTAGRPQLTAGRLRASMEPGHEDREYPNMDGRLMPLIEASMEPGHEDREYSIGSASSAAPGTSLNGARP